MVSILLIIGSSSSELVQRPLQRSLVASLQGSGSIFATGDFQLVTADDGEQQQNDTETLLSTQTKTVGGTQQQISSPTNEKPISNPTKAPSKESRARGTTKITAWSLSSLALFITITGAFIFAVSHRRRTLRVTHVRTDEENRPAGTPLDTPSHLEDDDASLFVADESVTSYLRQATKSLDIIYGSREPYRNPFEQLESDAKSVLRSPPFVASVSNSTAALVVTNDVSSDLESLFTDHSDDVTTLLSYKEGEDVPSYEGHSLEGMSVAALSQRSGMTTDVEVPSNDDDGNLLESIHSIV